MQANGDRQAEAELLDDGDLRGAEREEDRHHDDRRPVDEAGCTAQPVQDRLVVTVRALVTGTPVALLPEVLVDDDAVVHGGQVRFACRTSAHASGVDEVKMRAVAAHVFGRSAEADRP